MQLGLLIVYKNVSFLKKQTFFKRNHSFWTFIKQKTIRFL